MVWLKGGTGKRGVRTLNIDAMSVTLHVSRLNGWLNSFAVCVQSPKGGTPLGSELYRV